MQFASCPGGTGAMIASIVAGHADVAVALTEGIVAGVVNHEATGVPLRYCGQYVTSPLRWMIATGAGREFQSLSDVLGVAGSSESPDSSGEAATAGGRSIHVAVSRLGSGSHLMAYLLALRERWPKHKLSFVVCARARLKSNLPLTL
jgi:hypothetical protein